MRIRLLEFLCMAALAATNLYAQEAGGYRVGPKDVLNISVMGHTELTGKYLVAADGTVSFPLLGSVKVAERSQAEIAADLVARLADGFFKKPQVTVEIAEYLSQRVFVMGEVRTPGSLSFSGSTTLLEALARAGSLTEQAGGEVVLLRQAPGGPAGPIAPGQTGVNELARISVQQLRSGSIVNVALQDGDTIFVPRAQSVRVLGNVKSPGSYTFESGLTAIQAVYLAGGVSDMGTTGKIEVTRVENGKEVKVKAKPTDPLKPGDTIIVGTRRF
jgi:polysaccharide biosynthesis/export protein